MSIPDTRYLTWWDLADRNPNLTQMCENMAKIVSRASRLKCDDYRFKSATTSIRCAKIMIFLQSRI